MPEYYRLLYVSTRAVDLTEDDVDLIATNAAERNKELNVVGGLCYNGVNFAQILEGEKETVLSLTEQIKRDERHTGLIVVAERDVKRRHFDDWNMKRITGMNFDELLAAMNAD